MAVRIRMTRTGRKGSPCYRVGAYDSRTRRDGTCLEVLGSYEPSAKAEEKKLVINTDRVKHWISAGAVPSDKVAVLLRKQGIIEPKATKSRKKN